MEILKSNTDRVKNGQLKAVNAVNSLSAEKVTNPYATRSAEVREFVADKNIKLVDDYLKKLDWQVKENSNMTYSIQGLNNYISSAISKITG